MSTQLITESPVAQTPALYRIDLLGLFGVDELHEMVKQAAEGYVQQRMSVRPLHFVREGYVSLGWETCQASLNMFLAPTVGTKRFDIEGKYREVFMKPVSTAPAEKRPCSCHGMPSNSITELRDRFVVVFVQALYNAKFN